VPRNRKRAKERRARRPQPVARISTEREAPNPIGHAAPDVELAEAQLALGRPELAEGAEPEPEDEFEEERLEEEDAEEFEPGDGFDGGAPPGRGGELVAPGGVPEPRARPGNRLIGFLQGSWHELQRVQWPDRRQVVQATGVVLGFVIVAGVWLGVADTLASKIVSFLLK
jgi:preprotein translocase subunit SecE